MNYTFEYFLPIYDRENELVACIKDISVVFMEARVYHEQDFMGYNLILCTDGEYKLLETYEYEGECTHARLEIEKAFNENREKIYL